MNANEVIARLATEYAGRRPAGAPERPRQPRPEQQRRHPDGHPPGRGARRCRSRCCPRSKELIETISRKAARRRRHRQDRPHAPDGRDAGDARPGDGRVAHAARGRRRRGCRVAGRACTRWRRAARRWAPASTPIRNSRRSVAALLSQQTGLDLRPGPRLLRGAGVAGHGGRSCRASCARWPWRS